ncbi:hypothetical protein DFH28DRAFT_942888 [Melampsora americana]|nr:hypothetical protein DFH28DRAFT_942888 [Melampsora americana]
MIEYCFINKIISCDMFSKIDRFALALSLLVVLVAFDLNRWNDEGPPGAPLSSERSPEFQRSSFIKGLINGVPTYDTCASPYGPIPTSKHDDAPFSQGQLSYQRAIYCPHGIQNLPRGIVLLVPCTSCEATEVFAETPIGLRLPKEGFDLCWVNLPFHGLGDMQLSGEFVAFAVDYLAKQSLSGKINVVTYSQGGSNAQWAITFWPSIRNQIINLVTIAAPHKGTFLTRPICSSLNLIGGCLTSVLQMDRNSRYMNAVNNRTSINNGKQALVPTTSIYTLLDEIVTPQTSNPEGASHLTGASNIAIQDACGKSHIVEHFGLIFDMAIYGLVYDALIHDRPASLSTFDRKYCEKHYKNLVDFALEVPLDIQATSRTLLGNVFDRLKMIKRTLTSFRVPAEPLLMPYVCEKGFAPNDSCTHVGFCENNPTAKLF